MRNCSTTVRKLPLRYLFYPINDYDYDNNQILLLCLINFTEAIIQKVIS